ncbi:DUF6944 family repetitive protein [Metabacillus iocasae]|uniref:RING-type E3 ubiquitin transferase n=1 Tax=Priestia iocasae TaxID=2291674 RepID=A0ABS2QVL3_9BACI|nr:hypothetical protein [Metabacillus iocasae]MBM7702781.1 hypothetical protein [Metabacillus iocasae]
MEHTQQQEEEIILSGALLLALGTVIAAIGQTRDTFFNDEKGRVLVVEGNSVEAVGNAVQAIGRTKQFEKERFQPDLYTIAGCWIQAVGNTTNAFATNLEIQENEEEGIPLNALGSGVQSVGAAFEVVGLSARPTRRGRIEVLGNELIAVGSAIESSGHVSRINEQEETGKILLFVGGWVIVTGAFIELYGFSIDN